MCRVLLLHALDCVTQRLGCGQPAASAGVTNAQVIDLFDLLLAYIVEVGHPGIRVQTVEGIGADICILGICILDYCTFV